MKKGALLLAATLLLAGCASHHEVAARRAQVQARLQRYSALLLAMDPAGVAAMFAPDGEIVNPRQPPVHGRAAIQRFLEGYSDFKVLSNEDVADSTLIDGDTSEQLGRYHQRVRTPEGKVIEVSGRFEFAWVRDASGEWLLQQAATFPEPKA